MLPAYFVLEMITFPIGWGYFLLDRNNKNIHASSSFLTKFVILINKYINNYSNSNTVEVYGIYSFHLLSDQCRLPDMAHTFLLVNCRQKICHFTVHWSATQVTRPITILKAKSNCTLHSLMRCSVNCDVLYITFDMHQNQQQWKRKTEIN